MFKLSPGEYKVVSKDVIDDVDPGTAGGSYQVLPWNLVRV